LAGCSVLAPNTSLGDHLDFSLQRNSVPSS